MLRVVVNGLLRGNVFRLGFVVPTGIEVAREHGERCRSDLDLEARVLPDRHARLSEVEAVLINTARLQQRRFRERLAEARADFTLAQEMDFAFGRYF